MKKSVKLFRYLTSSLFVTIYLMMFSGNINAACDIALNPNDTIQDAIDTLEAAGTGGVICLRNKTYYENLTFDTSTTNPITLQPRFENKAAPVIDGSASGSVISISNGAKVALIGGLCGITIQNGSATNGGGINISGSSSLALNNITITGNSASSNGGGVYSDNSTVTISNNSTISANSASADAGGIYAYGSTLTINDSTISNNSASVSAGGLYCSYSSLTMGNGIISYNDSVSSSGGARIYHSSPNITNSVITYNTSANAAGLLLSYSSGSIITATEISYNDASGQSGGVEVTMSSGGTTFTSCNIINNTAGTNAGGINFNNTRLSMINCAVKDNIAGQSGGGISFGYDTWITVEDTVISGNSASYKGGGFLSTTGGLDSILKRCTISGNSVTDDNGTGGGGYLMWNTKQKFENCFIVDNYALGTSGKGGGLYITQDTKPTIIESCTISGNSATLNGGGLYIDVNSISTSANNSIIWGNTATSDNDIYVSDDPLYPGYITIYYSDIGQTGPWTGINNNISANPMFVGSGDYHLTDNSTDCIDAGATLLTEDYDGDTRPLNNGDDMGADEHYVAP